MGRETVLGAAAPAAARCGGAGERERGLPDSERLFRARMGRGGGLSSGVLGDGMSQPPDLCGHRGHVPEQLPGWCRSPQVSLAPCSGSWHRAGVGCLSTASHGQGFPSTLLPAQISTSGETEALKHLPGGQLDGGLLGPWERAGRWRVNKISAFTGFPGPARSAAHPTASSPPRATPWPPGSRTAGQRLRPAGSRSGTGLSPDPLQPTPAGDGSESAVGSTSFAPFAPSSLWRLGGDWWPGTALEAAASWVVLGGGWWGWMGFPCFPSRLCLEPARPGSLLVLPHSLLLFTLGWEEQVPLSLGFFSLPRPGFWQAKRFQPGDTTASSLVFQRCLLQTGLGMLWDPQGFPQTPHDPTEHHPHGSRE